MKSMTAQEILERVTKSVNGRMIRVCYRTDLPMKSKFQKQGVRIIKVVEETVRLGVEYSHIKDVIKKREESPEETVARPNPYEWVVKNKISVHKTSGKQYVRIATVKKGAHKKVKFLVEDGDVKSCVESLSEEQKDKVIDSYWGRAYTPEVKNISIDNIISIGC